MPVTVRNLLDVLHLELRVVAGRRGLDRSVRWAHTSELADPTPWLSGGELLLTTGMGLEAGPEPQAAYVQRLVAAGVTGLGFGVGFNFEAVPPALAETAEGAGWPIVEVPYRVPFIAIAEAVSTRLAEERLREAQLSVEVHERLASLVAESAGPADVLEEVAVLGGGWAMLFDLRGDLIATGTAPGATAPAPEAVWGDLPPGAVEPSGGPSAASHVELGGTRVAVPVRAGPKREGVLVFGKDRRLGGSERIVVHHATTVLGVLLASRRAVIDAQRRVMGDVLRDAFAGRLDGMGLERRLELIGFPPGAEVTALVLETGGKSEAGDYDLAEEAGRSLEMRCKALTSPLTDGRAAALVIHSEPRALAHALVDDLGERRSVRVGVGGEVLARSARHSYLCALFALRSAPEEATVASLDHLGAYGFLLGAQSRPVLEGYVRSVLGPLIEHDEARRSELVASVEAYIHAGGRWETGAEALGVHRHTLRYRLRRAEELLERDLSSEEGRLEVWLALKAAEILRE